MFPLRRWLDKLPPAATARVARVLLGTGVLSLALAGTCGLGLWIRARPLLRAEATVTENSAGLGAKGGIVYTTHLRFRLPDGEIVSFADPVQSSPGGDPSFATGEVVPVLYPAGHPERAFIATVWRFYFVANVLGIVGVVLVDIGMILRLALKRTAKDAEQDRAHR